MVDLQGPPWIAEHGSHDPRDDPWRMEAIAAGFDDLDPVE
jgi:hypothetical protein